MFSHQGSPFCKLAREALVELELPHLLHRYSTLETSQRICK
uniref:Glutaredoxin domain-containing protein n=1 Tax=Aegilops tauschii subsp. strangulata TaxID=200361 RepID=A0A453QHC1_AEGTS